MADRELKYIVKVTGTEQVEKLAEAEADLADATEDATKAADAQTKAVAAAGDAGAKAGGKFSKLWEGLKAGAGAAAGASAALAGMASTLGKNLSEETKVAIAGLQGLTGVLSAFGPVGQLAATGVSLAAAAIATFGGETALATAQGEGFLDRALKPINEAFKTTEDRANAAVAAMRRVKAAGLGDFAVLNAEEVARTTAKTNELNKAIEESERLGNLLVKHEQDKAAVAARYDGAIVSARQGQIDADKAALTSAQLLIDARQSEIRLIREAAEARLAGPAPKAAGGGGAKVASPAIDAEFAAQQAREALAVRFREREREMADEDAAWQADYYAAQEQAAKEHADYLSEQAAAPWAAMSEASTAAATEQDAIFGKLGDMAGAFGEQMAQAAAASLLFGGSFEEVAAGVLKSLAVQAGGEALMESARALAALAGYFAAPWNAGLLASAQTHGLAALGFAAIAGGAAAGSKALSASSSGGGGGGSQGLPPSAFGERTTQERAEESSISVNLNLGQSGRPLSRADGAAIIGALADVARSSGRGMGG